MVKCAGQFRQEVKFSASFLKGAQDNSMLVQGERELRKTKPADFLNLNLDGSRRSYLHPEGLGGQEFQFTPELDDYSENTQVQFFLHPTCTSFILRKLFLSHILF